MTLGGYAHRVAHVDLSTGGIDYQPIPEEWAIKYIGGRGLGVRYVLENGPQVDPLSPENILCFMNGPLTGTEANMSGRLAVVTKSPLTNTVTDSHMGGWAAARLRWAGFDGLVFKGKADKPVYAFVQNGMVELRDASELWGKGVHDTVKYFQEMYGEKDLSVMAIGQAGENQVLYACWMNEKDRASGRGGTGCVGGIKNLKAVVVVAEKMKPQVGGEKEAWKEARSRALATIMDVNNITSPRKGGLSVYGTNVLTNITNNMGGLPTRNSQEVSFGDRAEKTGGEWVKEYYLVDDPTCHACPVACKKEVEAKDGPFKGLRMESTEYESVWAFGANSGNDNFDAIIKMVDQCNDYGMDTIEAGQALAVFMEATQRGYTQTEECLEWGDWMNMVFTLDKIALRQGVGNSLAEGPTEYSNSIGHPELAMSVKGMSIPAYDPRSMKGMGLGYATSNRGACHVRGYSPASELGLISLKTDPLDYVGKGKLMKVLQDLHAFSDSMDLCLFSAFAEGADEYAMQYAACVGVPFTADDVLKAGERIYNLERYYNNLAGFGKGSDYLPTRFLTEPSTMLGSKGHICELPEMLAEYYEARGWDEGVVPEAKLKELEIV
jgi:aldehyde:ferredoxin oxidoreductase